jgi:hypothetical protein
MLGRRFHEAPDVSSAGKMLADGADHDDANPLVLVERLENQTELIALRHRNDIVGGTIEDDIRAFMRLVDFDAKSVEFGEAGIGEGVSY